MESVAAVLLLLLVHCRVAGIACSTADSSRSRSLWAAGGTSFDRLRHWVAPETGTLMRLWLGRREEASSHLRSSEWRPLLTRTSTSRPLTANAANVRHSAPPYTLLQVCSLLLACGSSAVFGTRPLAAASMCISLAAR